MAARPKMLTCADRTEAAICSMGVRGGMLRDNLEMSVRVEKDATLMIDSTTAVRLAPNAEPGVEYGIGIHASAESGSLLVIAPAGHIPSQEAFTGLWTRYDLSPNSSLVSVQLADLKDQVDRPPQLGGRYTSRTRVHHTTSHESTAKERQLETSSSADSSLAYINKSCSQTSISSCGLPFSAEPSWTCNWTFGRRFQGISMGTPTTNVIASIIMAGPRAQHVISRFKSIEGVAATHHSLGLLGTVHLAIQDVWLKSGDLVVARVSSESREDMHRLLHHCLKPLDLELGYSPYARHIHASSTAQAPIKTPVFQQEQGTTRGHAVTYHFSPDVNEAMGHLTGGQISVQHSVTKANM
uniref:Uncharacterized protein n=1 Tax=Haptolina brevifila TaxID=156173 RepID=A0A7S2N666_9EUKA